MKPVVLFAVAVLLGGVALWLTLLQEAPPEGDWLATAQAGYRLRGSSLNLSDGDIERIARLFHDEKEQQDEALARLADLPLELVGTIAGAHPFDGVATILHTDRGLVKTYGAGDDVGSGARLVAILRYRVVLKLGDELRELRVGEGRTTSGPAPAPTAPSGPAISYEGMTVQGDEVAVSRSLFDDLTGPRLGELLQQVLTSAVVEDGRIIGWSLSRMRKDSVFERLGFADGDVVTGINDFDLGEPLKAIQALQSLRTAESFKIRYRHGGRPREMNITVR